MRCKPSVDEEERKRCRNHRKRPVPRRMHLQPQLQKRTIRANLRAKSKVNRIDRASVHMAKQVAGGQRALPASGAISCQQKSVRSSGSRSSGGDGETKVSFFSYIQHTAIIDHHSKLEILQFDVIADADGISRQAASAVLSVEDRPSSPLRFGATIDKQ